MNRECPGCDYVNGRVCDDCLELIERKLDTSDILGGLMGCLIVAAVVLAFAAWVLS